MRETQETVGQWTRENFPQYESVTGRFTAIIEEMVECGMAFGVPHQHILSTVENAIKRELAKPPHTPNPGEELGDLEMNVWAFAEHVGHDAYESMCAKMGINRSRPKEWYDAKTKQKIQEGIRPNGSR